MIAFTMPEAFSVVLENKTEAETVIDYYENMGYELVLLVYNAMDESYYIAMERL